MKGWTLLWIATTAAALQEPEIVFEGATAFDEADLHAVIRHDLQRLRKDGLEEVALEDAAFRLSRYYRNRGYYFVQVHGRMESGRVVFRIAEGPAVRPGRLRLKGNQAVSRDELRESIPDMPGMHAPFSDRLLTLQVKAVEDAYLRRGFVEVSLSPPVLEYDPQTGRMDVTVEIKEGRRFRLAGVEGSPDEHVARLAERFVGRIYTPDIPSVLEAEILDYYRDAGRPFARVEAIPRLDSESAQARVELRVIPGPEARLRGLRFAGLERTRETFARGLVELETGAPVRASALRRAAERLQGTRLFRTVSLRPSEFQEETGELWVDVQVEERKPGELAIRGGYGSLDGGRVGLDFGYANLFGGAETFRIGATGSETGLRGTGELSFPYIGGTDLRFGVTTYYEERGLESFTVRSYGALPSISVPILDRVQISLGVRVAVIRTDDVQPGVPPGDLLNFEFTALSLSFSVDERDSSLLPEQGVFLNAVIEWSGRPFVSDIEFLKVSGRGSLYVPMSWGMVLAWSVAGGVIAPMDETVDIPIALRYFSGGTNTVRGFKYGTLGPKAGGDPTGGEVFLATQLEIRFPILGDLHGALFTDRGNVWFKDQEFRLNDMRWTYGVGLRFHTPAGAIAVDVAWNPEREPDEQAFAVHLSVGFPF